MKKYFIILLFTLVYPTTRVQTQSLPKVEKPKIIAFTFDACMTSGMLKKLESGTEKSMFNNGIIAYLHEEKIPATIFITGMWAEKYPEAVREIGSDPLFEIGNHSYSHKAFTADCYSLPIILDKDKQADILKTQEIIFRLTGKKPGLFRFPGGCNSPEDQNMVQKIGLKVVGWTFPSGDAFNGNTEAIIENVLHNARSGAIVVFHLSGGRYAPKTLDAIRRIIPALKKQGYEFVTVSKIMGRSF
jgi:peptidoglycan/xylan/chitin deacetylase (PgdA/CDA1 family)